MAKALVKAGLLEIVDSTERQRPSLSWKLDGEAVFLRITGAELRAIGVVPEEAAQEAVLAAPDLAGRSDTTGATEPVQEAPTGEQEGNPGAGRHRARPGRAHGAPGGRPGH